MANRIQLRRDTAANWTRVNPVLEDGEPGLEIDTNYVKYGDGNTPWTELPYASTGGDSSGNITFFYSTVQEGIVGPNRVTSITGNAGTGVSLTSETWAQLMWVPSTANTTIADIGDGPATYNWAYVDDSGFRVESNVANIRNTWVFYANSLLTTPGNVQVGTEGTYGNISFIDTISANNYVYANGVSILDGISAPNIATSVTTGTYSDASGDFSYGLLGYSYSVNGVSNSFEIQYSAPLVFGNVDINVGNITASNLTVNGNITYISTESYVISDNIIQLANANPGNTLDLGFVAHRTVNGTLEHTGLIREHGDGIWVLFSNVITQPGATVDFSTSVYDDLLLGNIYATDFKFANGTSILSTVAPSSTYSNANVASYLVANPPAGTYSNTNVASYLVANPQGSTYSNTNVAAYLLGSITTGNITSTSVAAGHLVMSGTAPDTTLGALGDLQSELRADTNYLYVSTGAYGGSNIATPTLTVVGPVDQNYYGVGGNRVRLSGVTSEYWTDIRTSPTVYWFSAATAIPATYVSDDGAGVFSFNIGSRSGYAGSIQYIVYTTGTSIWKTIPLTSFQSPAFGNANVAAYLAANPQASGTYSNTNVAAYLTTASVTTTGNISAGNVIGTHYGNAIGTTATYTGNVTAANIVTTGATSGNISGANYISANVFQVSTGIFWANGTSWSSTSGTTYSNTNVAAYLTAGNISIGTGGYTVLPNIVTQFTSNVNSYGQINMQNINSGAASTTEIVATANNGTDTTFFLDMGIAGNAYNNASPNNSLGTIIYANDAYLYAQGNTSANIGGNLAIGAATAGRSVTIFAGGINNSSNVATFAGTGVTVYGNITAANIVTTGTYGNITGANVISANTVTVTTYVRTQPVVFAALPSAAAAGAGARAFITDGNTTTFASAVTGSGIYYIPIFSNGTGWFVG